MTQVDTTKALSELTPQAFALFMAASGLWVRSLCSEKSQWVEQLADFLAAGGGNRQKLAVAASAQASIATSLTAFLATIIAMILDGFFGRTLRPQYALFYNAEVFLALFLGGWVLQLFFATRPHQLALTTEPWLPFKINDRFRAKPVEQMDFWGLAMLVILVISGALKLMAEDTPRSQPQPPPAISQGAAATPGAALPRTEGPSS